MPICVFSSFKNGSLTRERIRDERSGGSWQTFDQQLKGTPIGNNGNIGMLFKFVMSLTTLLLSSDRRSGLVVKASASRAEDPGFESRLRWDFSGSSHTRDLKIGTPVATLPGA